MCVWTNLLPTILTSFGVRARVHTHIWLVRLGCACSQMSANSVCTLVVHTMVVRFFQPKTVKTESEEERVIIVPTLLASFLINASIHTSKGVCDGDDQLRPLIQKREREREREWSLLVSCRLFSSFHHRKTMRVMRVLCMVDECFLFVSSCLFHDSVFLLASSF